MSRSRARFSRRPRSPTPIAAARSSSRAIPTAPSPMPAGATALGVALALGEVAETSLSDEAIARRMDLFSSVANTSAGGELRNCEILLFGNSDGAGGNLRIGHAVLSDVIDADGARSAVRQAIGNPDAAIDPE